MTPEITELVADLESKAADCDTAKSYWWRDMLNRAAAALRSQAATLREQAGEIERLEKEGIVYWKTRRSLLEERDALRAQLDATRKAYETVAGNAADLRAEAARLQDDLLSWQLGEHC